MDTDEALATALARDLDQAFERLVHDHADRLYTIALRMLGDPRDAEEAAQDALVRAYRALAGYEPARIRDLRLRPWLATIVLNRCRGRLTRRGAPGGPPRALARPADAGPDGTPADERPGPADLAERREAATEWTALLGALPPPARAAVILRHVDGLSYPEIAAALGRPEGTVKAQVHRGLALLRRAYAQRQRDRHGTTELTA